MKVLSFIIILLLVIFVLLFIGWSRAPDMLANYLSKKMGVTVQVGDLRLKMNDIKLLKFQIGNPSGSILPKAFSADEIDIQAPLQRYLDDKIVIDELDINNIYLGIEFESKKSKNGNWTTIMGNLSKGPKTEGKKGKTVLIKKLILTNINIDLAYRKEGEVQHLNPVKQIVLTDVSSEEGKLTDVITKIIIDQMLQKIFSIENLQNMLEDILNPNASPVEKALSPFKGLFK